jgi:3-oxoacyl-[acyl-carrier protein] reductase
MMGRSVLVTGASRGIGLAVARAFAAAGDRVTATYRATPTPPDLFGVHCDVTDGGAVHRAFTAAEQRHGPVEVVVANAGLTKDVLLARMAEDDFTNVLDTNLTGAYRVVRRAARSMLRARRGRLVFVSSAVAMAGEAGQVNYAASKAALIGLTRSLTRELGPYGITANVVAPGYTETDMTAAVDERRRAAWLAQIPLGRAATPAEVAAAVLFVAGEDAGYLTGAVIPVDGGAGMGH